MLKVLALGALATVLMLLDVVVCFPISGPEVTGGTAAGFGDI